MKKKYVQAMMAAMAGILTVAVPVTTVSAAVPEKEQTVYVTADESGKTQQVIVSNWLKNVGKDASLSDKTELREIENVKGEETFTQKGEEITWEAGGNDIYYQGKTDQELPVSVKMTYYLDGQEISPEQLAGKSGKVKIRIDYMNYTEQTVKIDGKNEKIQVPFLMATGMILPNDTFSNVEVKNGKVISDGKNNMVFGIGFPGLEESLRLSELEGMEEKEIPDYVEITADAQDFSLALTATVATTGTLNDLGLDEIDSMDDLTDSLEKLTDASSALVDGTQELRDGIETLDTSAVEFVDGLNSADEGAGKLKAGLDTMNGSKGKLLDGIDQLMSGMTALGSGAGELQSGVRSYTDGTAQLDAGISQVNEGAGQLKDGIHTLNDRKKELTDGVETLSEGGKQLQSGAESLQAGVGAYMAGANQLNAGLQQLKGELEASLGKAARLPEAVAALQKGCDQLETGTETLQAGVNQAGSAAGELEKQVKTLTDAAGKAAGLAAGAQNILQNPAIDTSVDVSGANESIRSQVQKAVAQENTATKQALTASVNQQQVDNVNKALAAAGLTEEQKAAVMANLGQISVDAGVQTTPDIKITEDQVSVKASVSGETLQALEQMQAGLGQIAEGLAKTDLSVVQGNLQQLQAGAAQASEGAEALKNGSAQLSVAAEPLKQFSALSQKLMKGVSDLAEGGNQLCAKENEEKLSQGTAALAAGTKELNAGMDALSQGAGALGSGVEELAKGADTLAAGTQSLKVGADMLIANNEKLSDGTAKLVAGSSALIVGGQALQSGGYTLSDGILQLADGASALKDGTGKLAAGGKELKEGTAKLLDGSAELADGMKEFDEEGIQELSSMVEGDLQNVIDRMKAVADADKSYTAFDGWDKDVDGSVKFIIETAGIE